jgi:hypothetical protein
MQRIASFIEIWQDHIYVFAFYSGWSEEGFTWKLKHVAVTNTVNINTVY